MPVMIYDPDMEREIRAKRANRSPGARDEVWEGVLVVPPLPNIEHQILATDLALAFSAMLDRTAGDVVCVGANVSDRATDWTENYREPDVLVVLHTNKAKHAGTHWVGGPDLAVEIASPGENPRLKLDFYAKVNTRELLIVDRYPWAVELYRLASGKMELVGTATEVNGTDLTSNVLPFTIQVKSGGKRPVVQLARTGTGQTWTA